MYTMQMSQKPLPESAGAGYSKIQMLQPVRIAAVAHHPLKIIQPETGTLKVLIFNVTVQGFIFVLYLCVDGKARRGNTVL